MRSIIVAVLVLKLVNCASVDISENELQHPERSRLKPNISESHLESNKSSRKGLLLSRREVYNDLLKKRCDLCRDTKRCKVQGKCDLCNRFCKTIEDSTTSPTEMPILGNIQAYSQLTQKPTTETQQDEVDSFEKPNRYYTVGIFGPGPKQSLIARLLNISKKSKLDKLVVLAKAKGKGKTDNTKHPVIIDTANAFYDGSDEVDANIYPISGNQIKATDLDLTSQIDHELDLAMRQKEKLLGNSHLTKDEVDRVLNHALALFQRKSISPISELENELMQLKSRSSFMEMPHLTTRRSIPVKKEATSSNKDKAIVGAKQPAEVNSKHKNNSLPQVKNNDTVTKNESQAKKSEEAEETDSHSSNTSLPAVKGNNTVEKNENQAKKSEKTKKSDIQKSNSSSPQVKDKAIVGAKQPPEATSKQKNNSLPEGKNNNTVTENDGQPKKNEGTAKTVNKTTNKENITTKHKDIGLGQSGVRHLSNDSKSKHNLINDNEKSSTDRNEHDYDSGEDVTDYEPRPPKDSKENEQSQPYVPDNLNRIQYTQHSSKDIPKTPLLKHIHSIISLPINNTAPLESASQHLENKDYHPLKTSVLLRPSIFQRHLQNSNIAPALQQKTFSGYEDIGGSSYEALQNSIIKDLSNKGLEDKLHTTTVYYKTSTIQDESHGSTQSDVPSDPIVGVIMHGRATEKSTSNTKEEVPELYRETESTDYSKESTQPENKKPEKLTVSESKLSAMNTSIFTLILQNLEKKVENIADLVKKTCGKTPYDIDTQEKLLGQKSPPRENREKNIQEILIRNDHKKPTQLSDTNPNILQRQKQIIESVDDPNNVETITPNSQVDDTTSPAKITLPPKIDVYTVFNQLQKGQKFLLDKTFNVADLIQETLEKPKQTNDKLSENRGLFSKYISDTVSNKNPNTKDVADESIEKDDASPEDEVKSNTANKEKSKHTSTDIKLRSGFTEGSTSTTEKTDISTDPTVGSSEEESGEYVGKPQNQTKEQKPPTKGSDKNDTKEDETKPDPKDKLPQKLRQKSRSQAQPKLQTPKPKADGAKQAKNNTVIEDPKHKKQPAPPKKPKTATEDELVGCSEEESEEYVGQGNHGTTAENANGCGATAEGCSSTYFSDSDDKGHSSPAFRSGLASLDLKKPNIVQKLLHPSLSTEPKEDSSTMPIASKVDHDVSTSSGEEIDQNTHNPTTDITPSTHQSQSKEESIGSDDDKETLKSPVQQKIPIQYFNINEKPYASSQPNKLSPAPLLKERFADGDSGKIKNVGADGFHVHRPKNLPNWPKLPDLVGATATDNDRKETTKTAHTSNPFSIFGRVVPQLNNTEISFHHIPSNKVYFVGTGMQLPLNMKKHADGSYQLSVDVEKLCKTCSKELCDLNQIESTEGEEPKDSESEEVASETKEQPNTKSAAAVNHTKSQNSKEKSAKKHRSSDYTEIDGPRKEPTKVPPQKIEILTLDAPILRNRRFPTQIKQSPLTKDNETPFLNEDQTDKKNSEKLTNNKFLDFAESIDEHHDEKEIHHSLLDMNHDGESKHSELSKRSTYSEEPSLRANKRIPKSLNFNDVNRHEQFSDSIEKFPAPSPKYMERLDDSLKKIDDNMKNYFNRRQRLENQFRNRNRFDMQHPDIETDAAKRRVTLVSNMLDWMKSIAVKNAHT